MNRPYVLLNPLFMWAGDMLFFAKSLSDSDVGAPSRAPNRQTGMDH